MIIPSMGWNMLLVSANNDTIHVHQALAGICINRDYEDHAIFTCMGFTQLSWREIFRPFQQQS